MRAIRRYQTERPVRTGSTTARFSSVTGQIARLWEPALAGEWFELTELAQRIFMQRRFRSDYS